MSINLVLHPNTNLLTNKSVSMDFNGDLLTCCGKTYLRAFLCPKCCLLNNQVIQYLRGMSRLWWQTQYGSFLPLSIPNRISPIRLPPSLQKNNRKSSTCPSVLGFHQNFCHQMEKRCTVWLRICEKGTNVLGKYGKSWLQPHEYLSPN